MSGKTRGSGKNLDTYKSKGKGKSKSGSASGKTGNIEKNNSNYKGKGKGKSKSGSALGKTGSMGKNNGNYKGKGKGKSKHGRRPNQTSLNSRFSRWITRAHKREAYHQAQMKKIDDEMWGPLDQHLSNTFSLRACFAWHLGWKTRCPILLHASMRDVYTQARCKFMYSMVSLEYAHIDDEGTQYKCLR